MNTDGGLPAGGHPRRVPPDVCCTLMATHLATECGKHPDPFNCADNVIYWSAPFDEYGLIVHDGGTSYLRVDYCPWCGRRLPESKRDRWFEEMERLGVVNPSLDDAPEPYASDAGIGNGSSAPRCRELRRQPVDCDGLITTKPA